MRFPSSWEPDPPEYDDLTMGELGLFLSIARECGSMSDFENNFCYSLSRRLGKGQSPTERQAAVLKNGLLWKLWDNNPEWWSDPAP